MLQLQSSQNKGLPDYETYNCDSYSKDKYILEFQRHKNGYQIKKVADFERMVTVLKCGIPRDAIARERGQSRGSGGK
jgi:hypothetical protein